MSSSQLYTDFSSSNLVHEISFPRRWAGYTPALPISFPSIARQVAAPERGLSCSFSPSDEMFQTLVRRLGDTVRASAIGTDIPRLVRKFRIFHVRAPQPQEDSQTDNSIIQIPPILPSSSSSSSSAPASSSSSSPPPSSSPSSSSSSSPADETAAAISSTSSTRTMSRPEKLVFNTTDDLVFNSTAEVFHDKAGQPGYRHRDVLIQDLLRACGKALQVDADADAAVEDFLNFIDFDPSISIHSTNVPEELSRFCEEKLGDVHPLVQVLKMCNQGMIAPAVTFMTLRNFHLLRYRDHRTSWYIDLGFHYAADGQLDSVTVIHRKSEISTHLPAEHHLHFEFTWYLIITLDAHLTITDVELRIVDLWFHQAVPITYQEQVTQLLTMTIGLIDPSVCAPPPEKQVERLREHENRSDSAPLLLISFLVIGIAAICLGSWYHRSTLITP